MNEKTDTSVDDALLAAVGTNDELSQEQQVALFERYVDQKAVVERLEHSLTLARGQLSLSVKEIYDKLGKGPFSPDSVPALAEQTLKVVVRGDTYFFRAAKKPKSI